MSIIVSGIPLKDLDLITTYHFNQRGFESLFSERALPIKDFKSFRFVSSYSMNHIVVKVVKFNGCYLKFNRYFLIQQQ